MAWSSLADNQMVSYTDAQGGGFTLNNGQSSVTSNQCMTKSDALTKYYIDSSYMSSYASNQLAPKSTWVAITVTYTYYGLLYPQNPCDPQVYVYYGSNGQWYYESGGNYYDITYVCQYSSYDPGQDIYIYGLYTLVYNNPTPVYYGNTTSSCPPF